MLCICADWLCIQQASAPSLGRNAGLDRFAADGFGEQKSLKKQSRGSAFLFTAIRGSRFAACPCLPRLNEQMRAKQASSLLEEGAGLRIGGQERVARGDGAD